MAEAGSCPDMCPKSNRDFRIGHNTDIDVFEKNPITQKPSQRRMVKPFKRDSADAPPAPPCDLRPEPVLAMTVNYMLHKILTLEAIELYGPLKWNLFVWDRTRSIVKDIRIQRIYSPTSVAIIEMIVRFYQFSSFYLSEDKQFLGLWEKFNNNQRNDAFEFLMDQYDILRGSHPLPNEAEFISYPVIKNLCKADVLITHHIPDKLYATPEVKFTREAARAFLDNNYVRFFRLARSAPFIRACSLHEHFPQVRARALNAIAQAYFPKRSTKPALFSLADMTDLLGFGSEEDALSFLTYYDVIVDEQLATLSFENFSSDKPAPPAPRTPWLLARLETESLAEILSGGPPPPFEWHIPAGCEGSSDEEGDDVGSEAPLPPPPKSVSVRQVPSGLQTERHRLAAANPALSPAPPIRPPAAAVVTAASELPMAARQQPIQTAPAPRVPLVAVWGPKLPTLPSAPTPAPAVGGSPAGKFNFSSNLSAAVPLSFADSTPPSVSGFGASAPIFINPVPIVVKPFQPGPIAAPKFRPEPVQVVPAPVQAIPAPAPAPALVPTISQKVDYAARKQPGQSKLSRDTTDFGREAMKIPTLAPVPVPAPILSTVVPPSAIAKPTGPGKQELEAESRAAALAALQQAARMESAVEAVLTSIVNSFVDDWIADEITVAVAMNRRLDHVVSVVEDALLEGKVLEFLAFSYVDIKCSLRLVRESWAHWRTATKARAVLRRFPVVPPAASVAERMRRFTGSAAIKVGELVPKSCRVRLGSPAQPVLLPVELANLVGPALQAANSELDIIHFKLGVFCTAMSPLAIDLVQQLQDATTDLPLFAVGTSAVVHLSKTPLQPSGELHCVVSVACGAPADEAGALGALTACTAMLLVINKKDRRMDIARLLRIACTAAKTLMPLPLIVAHDFEQGLPTAFQRALNFNAAPMTSKISCGKVVSFCAPPAQKRQLLEESISWLAQASANQRDYGSVQVFLSDLFDVLVVGPFLDELSRSMLIPTHCVGSIVAWFNQAIDDRTAQLVSTESRRFWPPIDCCPLSAPMRTMFDGLKLPAFDDALIHRASRFFSSGDRDMQLRQFYLNEALSSICHSMCGAPCAGHCGRKFKDDIDCSSWRSLLSNIAETLLALVSKDATVSLNPILLQMVNESATTTRKHLRSASTSPVVIAKRSRNEDRPTVNLTEDSEIPEPVPQQTLLAPALEMLVPEPVGAGIDFASFAETLAAERESCESFGKYMQTAMALEDTNPAPAVAATDPASLLLEQLRKQLRQEMQKSSIQDMLLSEAASLGAL